MKGQYNYGFELVQDIVKLKWIPEILAAISSDNRTTYTLLPFGEDLNHIFEHFIELEEKYLRHSFI